MCVRRDGGGIEWKEIILFYFISHIFFTQFAMKETKTKQPDRKNKKEVAVADSYAYILI